MIPAGRALARAGPRRRKRHGSMHRRVWFDRDVRTIAIATCLAGFWTIGGCRSGQSDPDVSSQTEPHVVGRAPAAARGVPAVVLLEPEPSGPVAESMEPVVMDQFALAFAPTMLVARLGQPVEFRNSEDVAHNVRVVESAADSTLFNVSTSRGESFAYTFVRPGHYAVFCDIHPGMWAHILAVTARYVAVAESDGTFAITNVPPGRYRVAVWHIDPAQRLERAVAIDSGRTMLQLGIPETPS